MSFDPELFKNLILAVLLMIILSLGTALYHLTAGKGDSGKMLKALTWRISLSVALLALLALAGHFGWFTPHDFGRPSIPANATPATTSQTEQPSNQGEQTTPTAKP